MKPERVLKSGSFILDCLRRTNPYITIPDKDIPELSECYTISKSLIRRTKNSESSIGMVTDPVTNKEISLEDLGMSARGLEKESRISLRDFLLYTTLALYRFRRKDHNPRQTK